MQRKSVIFDMDGVLVDTEPIYFSVTKSVLNSYGIEIPEKEHHSFVGISANKMWATLQSRYSIDREVESLIEQEKAVQYNTLESMFVLEPIEGIFSLLDALQGHNIPVAIASSSPKQIVDLILEKSKLRPYFKTITSGEEVARGKPHPDIFIRTSQKINTVPESCFVIEDSPHGIAGAKAAGMSCIGFQNLNSGRQDLSGADHIIRDFSPGSRKIILELMI